MNHATTLKNASAIQWHPQFQTFILPNNGVILLSEANVYWLPESQYPGITRINGQLTADDIASSIASNMAAATFFYQVEQLQAHALLINADHHCFHDYRQVNSNSATPLLERSRLSVSALSAIPHCHLSTLANALSDGLQTAMKPAPLHILLVDNFIHPAIPALMASQPHTLLIKVSGEQFWVSPLQAKSEIARPHIQWRQFQKRLVHNQPLRHWLRHAFPDTWHGLPINIHQSNPLSSETQTQLIRLVHQQLLATSHDLVLLNRHTHARESHPIHALPPPEKPIKKKRIDLREDNIQFNTDGGSRTCMPMETLSKLLPLVSPVTGIITQFEPIDTPATDLLSGDIIIYQTAYHKSVPKQQPFFSQSETENPPFIQVCMGKGVSPIQSQVSALSEAIERYSAMYADDEPDQITTPDLLPGRYLSYAKLYPLSDAQFATGNMFSKQPYAGEIIRWVQIWSLTHHEPVYVPQSACFSNSPLIEEQFGRWHSNGCAAGNTIEEAILQGLFELIERDATAIWWYNNVSRPAYSPTSIDPANLAPLNAALSAHHDYWLLDLTTDIGIPVMAAIAQNRRTQGYIMGFGCHISAPLAAQRALTELCQLIPIRDQNAAPFDFDAIPSEHWLHPNPNAQPAEKITVNHTAPTHSIKRELDTVIHRLTKLGFETLALDYERAHLPLEVAKVFVPGLCHIWPQFANERLYSAPVTAGWLSQPCSEATVNKQALLI